MTPFGFAALALLFPSFLVFVIHGTIAGVCFYAASETRLRGWRLLAWSSVVHIVAQLPHVYTTIAIRTESASTYGRQVMMLRWLDLPVTVATSVLTISGLYVLLDECRRLVRR